MFDLEYNPGGEFMPLVMKIKTELDEKASSEELETTNENVEVLSETVASFDEAISENTAAIAENKTAIEELSEKVDGLSGIKFEVVDTLPETGESGTIYLVPSGESGHYMEYVYANGQWEQLGSDIDLSAYSTKEELEAAVEALNASISEEAEARETAINGLNDALATETADREAGDAASLAAVAAVETALGNETTAREEAIEGLDEALANETQLRESALTAEATARQAADEAAVSAIENVTDVLAQEVAARNAAIADEIAAREAGDETAMEAISGLSVAIGELSTQISSIPKLRILIVDELPEIGDYATFYLLKTGDDDNNEYTEYVYAENAWEEIGTQKLDLSEYAKTADVNEQLEGKANVADLEMLSGVVENIGFEFESVDEKLAGLAAANLIQDEAIDTKVNIVDYDAFHNDFVAVKKLVGGTGANVSWSAGTKSELTDLLGNGGGTVNLTADITEADGMFQYTTPTFGSPTKTLNLRNHDIITSGRNNACMFLLRSDQELTITGGNITNTNTNGSSPDESTLRNPVFIAKGDSILNLSLGSSKTATTLSMDPVVVCQENATINIKSGNYITSDVCLIYCMNGLITITGGSFRSTADPAGFLINCLDASYQAGTANIVISSTSKTSGPKFYDFNPADCGSEGEHTNFVAEGCEAKESTETIDGVEHTVYTIVKSA